MGAAAEDLGGIAGCAVALGLLYILLALTTAVFAVVDNIGALGFYPFRSASRVIDAAITDALNGAIKGVERLMANFLSGLADSLAVLLGVTLIALILVKDALAYLWNHALQPLIRFYTDPIGTIARAAEALVRALEGTVAGNVTRAERYAQGQALDAYNDAVGTLRPEIAAGISAAERYASDAVEKLRAAEDTAIGHALTVAIEAQNAGIAAAASAESEAVGIASAALAASEAGATAALAGVKAIAIDAQHELDAIAAGRDAAGVAALIASIPLIATFVHTLATDTGLENQACRSKVKDICGTDPTQWANLLGGLAALGFAFSLKELYAVAEPLVADLAPLIAKAA